jgi:hypothetical protein
LAAVFFVRVFVYLTSFNASQRTKTIALLFLCCGLAKYFICNNIMKKEKSQQLYADALHYFPGGVNSPVRAFRAVGGTPIFAARGKGSRLFDADGNEFIDFCCSWGPLILGHNAAPIREAIIEAVQLGTSFGMPTEAENHLAQFILSRHSYLEKNTLCQFGHRSSHVGIALSTRCYGQIENTEI